MYDLFENGWPDVNENMDITTEKKAPPEFIKKLKIRSEFSPDFNKMRLREDIIVMVYDSLRQNGFQNKVLRGAKYLGECRTAHNNFTMRTGLQNPIVFVNNDNSSKIKGFIRGEAFAVTPSILLDLDYLRSNGKIYKREKKFVFLMDQEYQTKQGNKRPSVEAWIYVGMPEFWKQEALTLSPGICVNHDRNKRYYDFVPRHGPPHLLYPPRNDDGMLALEWMH